MEHTAVSTKQASHERNGAAIHRPEPESTPSLHPALQLQRQMGNQAMQRLLRAGIIQAKLAVSQPGDAAERQADAIADRIMRSHAGVGAAATCGCAESDDVNDMCDECKQKYAAGLARKASGDVKHSSAPGAHAAVGPVLRAPGHPLDAGARAFFEPRFGRDFGNVRVHTDSEAAESARSVSALAYAAGEHLVFDRGQYAPDSAAGRRLLAHELTHVVQQRSGGSSLAEQESTLPIEMLGEANADQVARNIESGRTAGNIDGGRRVSVQRQLFEMPPLEEFGNPGEMGRFNPGDIGKFGEWGKLGEFGKSSPLPDAEPIPDSVPNPTTNPTTNPTPNATPKPWLNPYPVPPIVPFPQPTEDEDKEKEKDPQCGTKELPLTMVTFFPGPLGQGGRVKASPLTKCPGNTRGSPPDPSIYRQEFDCIQAAGETGSWVRAHLLHGATSSSGPFNLHGPGNDIRNLIITDKSINSLMSSRAELPVISSVYRNNGVLWYDSKVDSYVTGKETFAQSVTVTAGVYNTATNTEGPAIPLVGGTFTLKRTPPNCPPGTAIPVTGAPGSSAQGITPAVPAGAEATTPTTDLEFQSTLKICVKELASREFKVRNGGLEVMIYAEWFDSAGENQLDVSQCPYDHYYIVLEQSGLLWGFNQYSQKPIRIPVGQRVLPLKWTGLQNDTYRLRIYVDDNLQKAASDVDAGAGAGSRAPLESCCLQGDITVSTFYAPASSPGGALPLA